MTRSRAAALLVVLLAVAAALGYRWSRPDDAVPESAPSLRPLIAQAALQPCVGELALPAQVLPDISLPCLDDTGTKPLLATAPHRQPPTVVNVYGSWCAPCVDEMPLLRQLHDEAGDRVRLVGVDTEDDHRTALHFAIDLGQRWPALRDDDGLVSRALGGGAPKTVFVDGSGKVVHVQRGTYRSFAALRDDVRRYLGVTV